MDQNLLVNFHFLNWHFCTITVDWLYQFDLFKSLLKACTMNVCLLYLFHLFILINLKWANRASKNVSKIYSSADES
jgi:hypothetical protein